MPRMLRTRKITFRMTNDEEARFEALKAFEICFDWSKLIRKALTRMESDMKQKLNAAPKAHIKPGKKVTRYNKRRKELSA